jgi:hypothetical protein
VVQAVGLETVIGREDLFHALGQVGIEATGQEREEGTQEIPQTLDGWVGERQHDGQRLAAVKENELPHLPAIPQGVPGGVRPEEVVQVADQVEVEERVAAAERLYLGFLVQGNKLDQGSPHSRTRAAVRTSDISLTRPQAVKRNRHPAQSPGFP